jgi:hypothetical protein
MVAHRTDKAYYIGTHPNSYRSGEAGEILSVITFIPAAGKDLAKVCFHVRFSNGEEDYMPVSDFVNYKIMMPDELGLFERKFK